MRMASEVGPGAFRVGCRRWTRAAPGTGPALTAGASGGEDARRLSAGSDGAKR